jgi:hypothetical protein
MHAKVLLFLWGTTLQTRSPTKEDLNSQTEALRIDPGDQKMLKNQSVEIARKWIHCVDLILTIPTQLERAQTEFV